ncbi:hypothetical protein [Paraburkholderia hayleyella]|uniref:hypothetical protein n=1 Tax=Paraburkholderia hayleyella TaxID=2152889 RepID=UPI00158034A0|nr:hypothetical protein [Paraburkholderia hayleyella]
MKSVCTVFALALVAWLCSACVQGGTGTSSSVRSTGASGITLYGTIDEGVTWHK